MHSISLQPGNFQQQINIEIEQIYSYLQYSYYSIYIHIRDILEHISVGFAIVPVCHGPLWFRRMWRLWPLDQKGTNYTSIHKNVCIININL